MGGIDTDSYSSMTEDINKIKQLADQIPEGAPGSTKVAGLNIRGIDKLEVSQLHDLINNLPESDRAESLQITKEAAGKVTNVIDHSANVEKDLLNKFENIDPDRLPDANMTPTDLKMMKTKLGNNTKYHTEVANDYKALEQVSANPSEQISPAQPSKVDIPNVTTEAPDLKPKSGTPDALETVVSAADAPDDISDTTKNTAPDIKTGFNRVALGASGAGAALSVVGLKNAIENGDTAGIVISGGDAVASGLDVAVSAGKRLPSLIGGNIAKANVVLMAADGIHQIATEEAGSKLARTGAVAATTATGMGMGAIAATVAAGGAMTTAAVVAAPIVAAVAVGYGANKVVESQKAYRHFDEHNAERADAFVKGSKTGPSGAPSIQNHGNLATFALADAGSKDNNPDVREAAFKHVENTNYSDPAVLDRLEEKLQRQIKVQDNIIAKNDSVLPKWVRNNSKSLNEQMTAERKLAPLKGAEADLVKYRDEIDVYNETEQTKLAKNSHENTSTITAAKAQTKPEVTPQQRKNGTFSPGEREGGSHAATLDTDNTSTFNVASLSPAFKAAHDNTATPTQDPAIKPLDPAVTVQPVTLG